MTRPLGWFFPALGGGEEQGLNEPGLESFKGKAALGRETCQNIGDARPRGSTEPAIATFELLSLPASQFPGRDTYLEILRACRDHILQYLPDGTGNETRFFEKAIDLLESDTVPTLRIRDENTTGLIGAEDERSSPFWRLIKGQGYSSLQGPGGGTYGIGQRAPFAHSALRTIIYSTRLGDGSQACVAKSILASHPSPEGGGLTQRAGWWCQRPSSGGGSWSSVRDPDRIPEVFRRESTGTDLYVTGFDKTDWERRIRHGVLQHLFAAIENRQIVVRFAEAGELLGEISSSNLSGELVRAADEARDSLSKQEYRSGLGSTLYFYKALRDPVGGQPIEKQIPSLGTVKLYVHRDERDAAAPDRWCCMRSPRILVEHFGSGLLTRFGAVLLADTDEGNRFLSAMEDPEHRRWHEDQRRNATAAEKKEAREARLAIARFVKESLKGLRDNRTVSTEDIPLLSSYLPLESDPDQEPAPGVSPIPTAERTDTETGHRASQPAQGPVTGRANRVPPGATQVRDTGAEGGDSGATGGRESGGGGGEPGARDNNRGAGPGDQRPVLNPANIRFRSFASGNEVASYELVVSSDSATTGDLLIRAVGEDSDYRLTVESAQDVETGESLTCQNSRICSLELQPGTSRRLRIKVDSDVLLCLGVKR